ncbi:MAG: hypothetical protein DWQ29_03540, partial [Planctomycetota bacterium]
MSNEVFSMTFQRIISSVCIVSFAGCWLAPRAGWAQSEEEIEAARVKGVEYLKSQQGTDGSWFFNGHVVGITALAGMALVENGIPVTDPSVEKAHAYVRRNTEDLKATYDLALAILFLSRVGDRDNRGPIRDMAARLIAGQNLEGGWSYNCPLVNAAALSNRETLPDPPEGPGDNSCTQFAVLGLWTASRWGVDIDDTMLRVGERFVDDQLEDGGWPYRVSDDGEEVSSRNSMTFAGLFCLTVARATEIRQMQEETRTSSRSERTERSSGTESETLLEDPVFAAGLERASAFAKGINQNQARYFLWSVERLGVLLEISEFGDVDWFERGADALIQSQRDDGAWVHPNDDWGNIADTAFAVLFLRKANLGSDISRLLRGEPARKFSNMTKEDEPEYRTLLDAIEEAEAGDVIRVNGSGPFDMPHINLEKDLVIEAGPGYAPVFRYAIGYDKRGRRTRPEEDPDARFMLRVSGGTLTLEGLELQMDPPSVRGAVTWAAVVLNGGNLRMLNCSVAEDNERGMASIVMTAPGSCLVRNSKFVGGRAGFEVHTNGEQEVQLNNCVVFSQTGFTVLDGAESESPQLTLRLNRCAVQARDVFAFARRTTPVDIVSTGCAYKADWLGASMLPEPDSTEGLTWEGKNNIYDVRRWVGASGSANPAVKDETTWSALWNGNDVEGTARLIPFLGKLRHEAFNHSVSGEDFEFDPNSALNSYRRESGINALIIGPGEGFTRFRESFDYREWEQPEEES